MADKPTRSWDIAISQHPKNVAFVDNDMCVRYDLALVHSPEQAQFVKNCLAHHKRELPTIGLCHGLAPEKEYLETADLLVVQCGRNKGNCAHPRIALLPLGFDPADYEGYTGDIGRLVTIASEFASRQELRPLFTNAVVKGEPHSFIGSGNKVLDNGIGYTAHADVKAIMRHFRGMVYAAIASAGSSYAVGEALMTGMPVALSDFADWRAYIVNGVNGMVSDSIDEVQCFCRLLLSSKRYAREVGERGREMMIQHFTLDKFLARWDRLFTLALRGEYDRAVSDSDDN
jgi:glycosyltransferase involved in cell wall biosynthesis